MDPVAPRALLIVWHSVTGATWQLAQAAARAAAKEPNVLVRLVRCNEAHAEDLLDAQAYLFACPENLASMAGLMKDFFDRTYYPVLERIQGRPYAMLIAAGSDGQGAARQIARIALGWRLRPVAEPVIVITHAQTPEAILAPKTVGPDDLERAAELGAALAAGLALGIW